MTRQPHAAEGRTVFTGGLTELVDALARLPKHATLAIVGSTALDRTNARAWWLVDRAVYLLEPESIISGGAPGVDTLAEEAAIRWGVASDIRRPDIQRWWAANGKKGFAERNLEIATVCTALVRVAWVGSTTYGSGWTRDRAAEMGKPTATFWLEKE